jgi:nitronate monooxygenase
MLKTRFSELFGLRHPIMSAPMANHSGGRLAAAVSAGGGLGTFGGINPGGPDWIRQQISIARTGTDADFGVGFITNFIRGPEFEVCLEEHVPVIVLSFGDPTVWMKRIRGEGLRVVCQVQTLEGVRQARDLGADAIIVQGNEAGGHSGYMMTLPLLSMAADLAGDVPLVAAGGIANGRGLAGVLAAGAEGAMLGTAFLATPECAEVPDHVKQRIVESDGQDTIHSQIYDIMSGAAWPEGIGGRCQANSFTREWAGREEELRERREDLLPRLRQGQQLRDPDFETVWMGQSAGMVTAIRPAAEVISSICEHAEVLLRKRPKMLLAQR